MIVSASYRTDIPAFHAAWFARRLAAGYALVANPYGGPPYRVSLDPADVDGYVFWTRNAAPFRDALEAVRAQGVPFVVQFTATGYPRALEPSVIAPEMAVAQLRGLARRYGPRVAVWRYDPVLLSDLTPPAFHRDRFAELAAALKGSVDEVVLSFAQAYRKTRRNLERAGRRHGFTWQDPPDDKKQALLAEFAGIAADHSITATICSQPGLGGTPAACIDAARLADVAGRPLRARRKGNRPGCLCAESRDIGAYDSCPHGCVYCYAVSDRDRAVANHRRHDPEAEFLLPPPG
ncbi:MAG TPA: DUF1848 domain-containing protein [Alphaproteobacteria bacterium]|nr:DUF1848 domain-containing protein [Alphaproteobacteria bacterium]